MNLLSHRLLANGYAGTKEWVQYAVTPYQSQLRMVAGCTGGDSGLDSSDQAVPETPSTSKSPKMATHSPLETAWRRRSAASLMEGSSSGGCTTS